MTRFVVLFHDWPEPHFDLLVEANGQLRAWRLLSEPRAGCDILAEPNFPHRLFYLDYEGPLSSNRGSVSRWDAGICVWNADTPEGAEFELRGEKLAGKAVSFRRGEHWLFRVTGPEEVG